MAGQWTKDNLEYLIRISRKKFPPSPSLSSSHIIQEFTMNFCSNLDHLGCSGLMELEFEVVRNPGDLPMRIPELGKSGCQSGLGGCLLTYHITVTQVVTQVPVPEIRPPCSILAFFYGIPCSFKVYYCLSAVSWKGEGARERERERKILRTKKKRTFIL